MQTDFKTSSLDAFGRRINVKYVYLGSIFPQFIVSRVNVDYFHYVWPTCGQRGHTIEVYLSTHVHCIFWQIRALNWLVAT